MTKELTHSKLVDVARRYLLRKHPVVVTEMATIGEEADAIGWSGGIATLVEAKVSRTDYYSDKNKLFRRHPSSGMGSYRYFITPKNLLIAENLPPGWGLLETDGHRVFKVKSASFVEANHMQEKTVLMSAIRRIGQSCPKGVSVTAYYMNTGQRASLSIEVDEVVVHENGYSHLEEK